MLGRGDGAGLDHVGGERIDIDVVAVDGNRPPLPPIPVPVHVLLVVQVVVGFGFRKIVGS